MISHPAAFKALLKRLRKGVPTAFPVRVRIVEQRHMPTLWGDCDLKETAGKWFSIRIAKDRPCVMCLVLVHEWAHARAWSHVHDHLECRNHDAAFGVAYAECWSCYAGE